MPDAPPVTARSRVQSPSTSVPVFLVDAFADAPARFQTVSGALVLVAGAAVTVLRGSLLAPPDLA